MKTAITKERAIELLKEHNKEPFHILHGLTVGAVLRWYANELGYGDDADFWEVCGILHDIDFEEYPDEHCIVAPRLLKEAGAEEELIHAVVSHGYGHRVEVKPEHEMEKVLYAADELTGLIWAAAKMRPSKSTKDMEVSSLKKKFKDKRFAAGCSRDVIEKGAEGLGWELPKLMEMTILAMRACEDEVNAETEKMGAEV
jgi:predicted hydrolase (HD superfamily)